MPPISLFHPDLSLSYFLLLTLAVCGSLANARSQNAAAPPFASSSSTRNSLHSGTSTAPANSPSSHTTLPSHARGTNGMHQPRQTGSDSAKQPSRPLLPLLDNPQRAIDQGICLDFIPSFRSMPFPKGTAVAL